MPSGKKNENVSDRFQKLFLGVLGIHISLFLYEEQEILA
jgi:hypothetical protein